MNNFWQDRVPSALMILRIASVLYHIVSLVAYVFMLSAMDLTEEKDFPSFVCDRCQNAEESSKYIRYHYYI
jgi:hypothetical protein